MRIYHAHHVVMSPTCLLDGGLNNQRVRYCTCVPPLLKGLPTVSLAMLLLIFSLRKSPAAVPRPVRSTFLDILIFRQSDAQPSLAWPVGSKMMRQDSIIECDGVNRLVRVVEGGRARRTTGANGHA